MAASGLLCFAAIDVGHDWGSDFALYVSQARALVEGSTERLLAQQVETNTLSNRAPGPLLYPVGYPLLLAPLYALRGVDLVAFKLLGAALFVLSLPVCFLLFRDRLGAGGALLLTALVALGPGAPQLADHVLSDVPFFLAAMAAMVAARRWHPSSGDLGRHMALGMLLAAAFLTRTVGIALVAGVAAQHLVEDAGAMRAGGFRYLRQRWPAFIPYAVFVLLILVAAWLYPAPGYPFASLGSHATAVLENARYYLTLPAEYFGNTIVFGATVPFFLLGLVRNARKDVLSVSFCAVALASYLVWPSQQGTRFILPLLPFFLYFTLLGAMAVRDVVGTRMIRAAGALLLLAVTSKGARVAAADWLGHSSNQAATAEALEMYDFVMENSAPEDLVVFFKPRAMRLFTARNAFRMRDLARIVGSPATLFVSELPVSQPGLVLAFQNVGFFVYRITRSP